MTLSLIASRQSTRAFLDRPVPRAILEEVLIAAAHAASAKNSQPWRVEVVTGNALVELQRILLAKFDADIRELAEYIYTPHPLPEEFQARARELGLALFKWKGIEQRDLAARRAHDRENYRFFGAPAILLFHLPCWAERGTFLDLGLFIQNVMLGLLARGVAGCPQASLTRFTKTIKDFAGIGEDRIFVCGYACGYADESATVNAFSAPRIPLKDYVRFKE